MSAPTSAPAYKSPTAETGPESPTTARPLDLDDDDVQETSLTEDTAHKSNAAATPTTPSAPRASSEEVPPPKPPRPMSEAESNVQTLKEAFPSIDLPVIKAVLTASGGRIEPAFHALLQMTDPEAAQQDVPPPPPPRPVAEPVGPTSTAQSQLEADELYARQLAEHFESVGAYEARTANSSNRGPGMPRGRQQTGFRPPNDSEREPSFLDDEFPVIKESLRKGFIETQTKVNSWFTNLKKRIDEQLVDKDEDDDRHAQGSSSFMGRPTRDQTRRSADYDRYDADPQLLSDDFAGMKFHSDGTPIQNTRAVSNPHLFKPPPPSKSPKPADGRRVAFRESVEDIGDVYDASPRMPPKETATPAASAGRGSKWQPLSAVEPSPIAENDPFSLGDSDDERDTKGSREIKMEDTERLRKATADAMAESLVDDKPKTGDAADKK
ncbi:CUE domain-containing protein 5 [Diplogelasinospora grovesii]|uniref:CUE domain-containing protein 5 n=1 Tax=Diplogelasinospora grovesii TaxID=303347 RepID=A0AAN6S827_9PEZI|nr:CUE domain-containing protein 5 [Diplogelasinospora grovesii]